MKKILVLLLAVVALCGCTKETETTGKLTVIIDDEVLNYYYDDNYFHDYYPYIDGTNATIYVAEFQNAIRSVNVKKKKTIELNPGNYQIKFSLLSSSYYVQIMAGHTTTCRIFLDTNRLSCNISYN